VSILGTRVLRVGDPRFLTTGGVYTEDIQDEQLAGAGHVFFVRSPIAHARISRIDVSQAASAPGVVAVFTGADLADLATVPPMMPGLVNPQMWRSLLATDIVRYVGEPVAVVVTDQPGDLRRRGRARRGALRRLRYGGAAHHHQPARGSRSGGSRSDGRPRRRGRLGAGRAARSSRT